MNKGVLWRLCKRLFSDGRITWPGSQLLYVDCRKTTLELQRFNHFYYNIRKISSSEEVQLACSNCKSPLKKCKLVCTNCNCLQEPCEKVNYFELFDHPLQFDLDVSKVSKCYRELQSRLHPDKFTGMTEKDQKLSEQHSAYVNKAYKTLSNRMERGLYLLELHEMPLLENTVQMDSDFLMHIMEINEKLDSVNDIRVLEEIVMTNTATINALFHQLSRAFKESDIERARYLLARLKYYYSIDEQILKAEERLGFG